MYKYKTVRNDIIIDGGVAIIEFYRFGLKYTVRLPFNSSNRFKLDKFYLLKDEEEIEITHMPGIPYFLTAEQMGGRIIVKRNIETEVNFFKNEIPEI